MEDGRWKMEDGRWKMEDGRWKMAITASRAGEKMKEGDKTAVESGSTTTKSLSKRLHKIM
ncbi:MULTISPECIES: hypothetical protein [unclassified Microcoleus]|uniref:hypothetical protein n=1 Tax=unclassified Microcoleus TaxID=2642155 RepID=UPI002FD3F078